MQPIEYMNFFIFLLFFISYAYQIFYILYVLVRMLANKSEKKGAKPKITNHSFAVLISARNEEAVIGYLIDSIKSQSYPEELISIFVVADNCTDSTADVARKKGAAVYERHNLERVGKGYAIDYLIGKINEDNPRERFDAYLVFDADNVLDKCYIEEMNKTYCEGYNIITSYRNSKNYGDNWISAGYSLWFLRESKYLNYPRYLLNTSCAISGTGFLVSREIIERNGGWKFYLLTEDIEFTVKSIMDGEKIGYCKNAVLYDEQPVKFVQSWKQRLRWAKGYFQVFGRYGKGLLKDIFTRRGFSYYDMSMTIMPAFVITVLSIVVNLAWAVYALVSGQDLAIFFESLGWLVGNTYLMLFGVGLVTTITEWKNIYTTPIKKILYNFTFPIFMMTYIPISVAAAFRKVEWSHIEHSKTKTLDEIKKT